MKLRCPNTCKTLIVLLLVLNIATLSSQINFFDAIRTGNEISKNDKRYDALPPKLIQTAWVEISLPDDITYHYDTGEEELRSRLSFASFYTVNYPVLKKITLGIIGGVQHQSQGSITGVKFGGILRYYFKNYESANFYFMTARSIGVFGKIQNSAGYGNARFGLEFPIEKNDNIIVILNLFWDNDSYKLKKPILKDETPNDITFHKGYGIGLGIQF